MGVRWLLLVVACALTCAGAERNGGSLRGALEALQRRQRGRFHVPETLPDYDAFYEYLQPQLYQESDYGSDVEVPDEDPAPKYIIKFLDAQRHPPENYEYKVVNKKNSHVKIENQESPFRERSHHAGNDKLRDLFTEKNEIAEEKQIEDRAENDAEYAMLLSQLWSKYKNNRQNVNNMEDRAQGIVKLYKDKKIKKRTPDSWGPIAFKKKRSPDANEESTVVDEYTANLALRPQFDEDNDPNFNAPEVDKNDFREEYAIAFQPLEDEEGDISNEDRFSYDVIEKRFPVSKRSSGPFVLSHNYKKRFANENDNKNKSPKKFRSSSGTDPRIIKDLSKIFGQSNEEVIKSPVKRSSDHHETKPPQVAVSGNSQNTSNDQNATHAHEPDSHELHGHNMHHPGVSGKEVVHSATNEKQANPEKPIILKKKAIDWSKYFGIDKRFKKSIPNNMAIQDRIRKQYFNTFNKEVFYPLNSGHAHIQVKRNFVENKPEDDGNKNESPKDNDSKLDDIDKKLKTMESLIVDEALHYTNVGEELDSKEEQEVKEKLLSRLAAAYSLEKMRKAMKEFKQSLKMQNRENKTPGASAVQEEKSKRIAVKKEKAEVGHNNVPSLVKTKADGKQALEEFEGEQGAGQYANGPTQEHYSEGYMGGSPRHLIPLLPYDGNDGSCPILGRIIDRCQSIDQLAGDRGQIFLPLCNLHQICYLCAQAPHTMCDLLYLSEADTFCDGDGTCQRAARSTLMTLRELHDVLADDLDGECENNPCLLDTLKVNTNWQRALQR